MVIGANDGTSFDPGWHFGYFENVPHHKVVWVEPIPILYDRLDRNTRHIKQRVLLNVAARPETSEMRKLELICWNISEVDRYLNTGISAFPTEITPPKDHWKAECSTSVDGLERSGNVYESNAFQKLTSIEQSQVRATVRQHMVKYTPDALSPVELLERAQVKQLRYLQIDVEFMDNEIVRSLPFSSTFKPNLIVYENHFGDKVRGLLEEQGYYWCCCLKYKGSNCVAVHRGTDASN